MFFTEITNSKYEKKDQLLTKRLKGKLVFKITNYIWERYCTIFDVKILEPNITMECRPQGLTEDNIPVYTRTAKVTTHGPFPDDAVR